MIIYKDIDDTLARSKLACGSEDHWASCKSRMQCILELQLNGAAAMRTGGRFN